MFDLELLRTFVSVVDAGGFTKAGERVNRTQSTISQQIRKLEEQLGRPVLLRQRAGKTVQLTEDGEKLLGYARRLVALALEAHNVLSAPQQKVVVRLGVPEDFDVQRLMLLLSGFSSEHPSVRLDTSSGISVDLHAKLEAKEIDLALVKRNCKPGSAPALCQWPEQLTWVAAHSMHTVDDPVPLAVFPPGCIYRDRVIRALESAGRRWRVAFESQSLTGIQAAVSAGLGIGLLPSTAVLEDHRPLRIDEGFGEAPPSELALIANSRLLPQVHRMLADYLKVHLL